MCRKAFSLLLALALVSQLYADTETLELPQTKNTPWLTGPLIAPEGTALKLGQYEIEPYLTFGTITGEYNKHWKSKSEHNLYSLDLQLLAIVGLTDFMDIQIIPGILYNFSQGQSDFLFTDFPVTLDFQLADEDVFKWFPAIKLAITETFPTGNYQKLKSHKHETDISGLGSYATSPGLVFYKVYRCSKHRFLSLTASFQYTYFAPVHIKGLSVYGGGPRTRGKVYPGNLSTAIVSFEYTLTRNWVFALDNVYLHADKDRFRGRRGKDSDGQKTIVGRPSSESLSFAPAIEYNFNEKIGLIAGVWFSAAGRNSLVFRDAVVAFECSY